MSQNTEGWADEVAYERQSIPRGCGAACLAMVYRALRRPEPQEAIWARIAARVDGEVKSSTHRIALDAAERGYAALAVQARDPLAALRACSDAGAHAILATRLSATESAGHYTVLLDIDSHHVRLHDPIAGPARTLTHAALLSLWEERPEPGEVAGRVLIAIGRAEPGAVACTACRAAVPQTLPCPRCLAAVGLRPLAALGCLSPSCTARRFDRLCCPGCDLLWAPGHHAATGEPIDEPHPLDLSKVFGALDRFVVATRMLPGAAGHADLTRLLGALDTARGAMTLAAEADAKARGAMAVKRREAAAKVAADIAALQARQPPPPADPLALTLDGVALAEALLARLVGPNGTGRLYSS